MYRTSVLAGLTEVAFAANSRLMLRQGEAAATSFVQADDGTFSMVSEPCSTFGVGGEDSDNVAAWSMTPEQCYEFCRGGQNQDFPDSNDDEAPTMSTPADTGLRQRVSQQPEEESNNPAPSQSQSVLPTKQQFNEFCADPVSRIKQVGEMAFAQVNRIMKLPEDQRTPEAKKLATNVLTQVGQFVVPASTELVKGAWAESNTLAEAWDPASVPGAFLEDKVPAVGVHFTNKDGAAYGIMKTGAPYALFSGGMGVFVYFMWTLALPLLFWGALFPFWGPFWILGCFLRLIGLA